MRHYNAVFYTMACYMYHDPRRNAVRLDYAIAATPCIYTCTLCLSTLHHVASDAIRCGVPKDKLQPLP